MGSSEAMREPLKSVTIDLPPLPKCSIEGCAETDLQGRGLCHRHYAREWQKASHVFHPKKPQGTLFQARVFLYEADLESFDALAKERGLTRSELVRELVREVTKAVREGGDAS